jgi:hypothetical protein
MNLASNEGIGGKLKEVLVNSKNLTSLDISHTVSLFKTAEIITKF